MCESMKKLSLYVFLGLLWCNVGFAEDLSTVDINQLKKLKTKEIKAALINKKITGYYQWGNKEPYNFEEIHEPDEKYFQDNEKYGKISGEWKVKDDELCYKYYKTSFWEADKEFKCGISVYTKYDIVYYFFSIDTQAFFAKTTSSIDLTKYNSM